jgi:hypothetical protein
VTGATHPAGVSLVDWQVKLSTSSVLTFLLI